MNNLSLEKIAPPSITRDEKIKALCAAITEKLKKVYEEIPLTLILPRLDELDDDVLDLLAWQYHVDFYDSSAAQNIKRTAVRNSVTWHRRKGTPSAVQEVVENFFQSAEIEENWEYGGDLYHFRVRVIKEPLSGDDTLTQLLRAITVAKDVRSWLDGVEFYRQINGTIYYGSVIGLSKTIEIRPAMPNIPDISQKAYYGGALKVNRKVEING